MGKDFCKKFAKDSNAKLFLVIYGIDEADPDRQAKLFKRRQQISKDENNIIVDLAGRPDMSSDVEVLNPVKIELTKQKLSERSGDLWRIINARYKTLSKLRQLSPFVRRRNTVKVRNEHILRVTFPPVRLELRPNDTQAFSMLNTCYGDSMRLAGKK